MKGLYIILLGCFSLTVLHAQQLTTNDFRNVVLERNGDWMEISFETNITNRTVGKKESLFLFPRLFMRGKTLSLPYIQLNGSNRCKALKRAKTITNALSRSEDLPYIEEDLTKRTNKNLRYAVEVPYEDWMDEAQLFIEGELHGCAGVKKFFSYEPKPPVESVYIAEKVVKKQVFLEGIKPKVSYVVPELSQKSREEKVSAYLDFPQGQSAIIPSFRNNQEEIRKIRELTDRIQRNDNLEVTSINIVGWASPEGNYQTNQQLSWERAYALRGYLTRNAGLPAHLLNVQQGGEDWETLRDMVSERGLPGSEQILSIIDGWDDFDQKEMRLRSLGMSYNMLLSDIYPALRRVDYIVEYSVRNFDRTESRAMLESNPSHLSPYELFHVASNYERETEKWNDIVELTVSLHPNDVVANINAAGVLLNKGDLVAAKVCLDKVEDVPGAWNNLGVYYLYRGDIQKATEYLTKSMYVGVPEAAYNMDIRREMELYLVEEDY